MSLDFAIRKAVSVEWCELISIISGRWGSVNNSEHPDIEKESFSLAVRKSSGEGSTCKHIACRLT